MDAKHTEESDVTVQNELIQPSTELAGVGYSSREATVTALNECAGLVTKSSCKQCNAHYTVHHRCDRGGSYRNLLRLTEKLED